MENKMNEPATDRQLQWLKGLGYDIENVSYTKKMAADIIGSMAATPLQIETIKKHGFDVSKGVTKFQAILALKLIGKTKKIFDKK